MNITKMKADYDACEKGITDLKTRATEEGRDLTDEETAEVETFKTRSKGLYDHIVEAGETQARQNKVNEAIASFSRGTVAGEGAPFDLTTRSHGGGQEPEKMEVGEYVSLYLRSLFGAPGDGLGQPDLRAKDELSSYRERLTRSAQAGLFTRSVADQVLSDNLGLVPTFIIGDVVKFVDANRYLVSIMRGLPMPQGGKSFTRPRVTQRTSAGQQTNEFDQLTSQAMLVTGDTVNKTTQGTVLSLSEQDIDWTDPALLQIVIEDMAQAYAIQTESVACTAVQNAVTSNVTPFDQGGDPAAFITGAAQGAAALYSSAKRLPDSLLASVDMWAYLAGLVDTTGRPVFPNLNPVNAPGQLELTDFRGNPMGLRLVVSPEFTSGTLVLAASHFLEAYEQNKGFLQLPSPSTLSVTVAYRGYFAANVYASALQGLTAA